MRALRTRAGLSQRAMADRLGVTLTYIQFLEAGRRNPSGDLILQYWDIENGLAGARGARQR